MEIGLLTLIVVLLWYFGSATASRLSEQTLLIRDTNATINSLTQAIETMRKDTSHLEMLSNNIERMREQIVPSVFNRTP